MDRNAIQMGAFVAGLVVLMFAIGFWPALGFGLIAFGIKGRA